MEVLRFCGNCLKFLLGLSLALGGILLGVTALAHVHLSANQILTAFVLVLFLGMAVNWVMTRSH